jgi:alpha-tubulin suppressor-like RCC1 family protein
MTRAALVSATLWLLCAGCSSELRVLDPLLPGEMLGPVDAGALDAALGDGGGPGRELDAGLPSLDGAIEPDGAPTRALPRTASAFSQTCAVVNRSLFCWGNDANGQVGVPGNAAQLRPVRIDGGEFLDVCTGERHSCALRADGAVLCWGSNERGQLGVGDFLPREQPTELSARRFGAIACGGLNTCGLSRGELFCWGDNEEGRLGQGDPPPEAAGTLAYSTVPLAVRTELRFARVSMGQGHLCAISDSNTLHCWGRNTTGQLGVREAVVQLRTPGAVEPTSKFARVSAGQRHTCAIDLEGKLFCWGDNARPAEGLLGLNTDVEQVRTPALVGDDSDYAAVDASWFHTCALKKSGSLMCWGRNEEGQLGLGDMRPRTAPTRTGPQLVWRSFTVGQFHTCAFESEGLSCWGANDVGQLGLDDTARRYVAIRVRFP